MPNILCAGPGPHVPADGILGTADRVVTGMLCPSTACQAGNVAAQAAAVTQAVNRDTLLAKLPPAFTANATFLGLARPVSSMTLAQQQQLWDQTVRVTRQWNALARVVAGLLDDTSGT